MQGSHWFALLYWPRYCQCFCRTEGKTTETFDPEHRLSGHVSEEWGISLQLTDKLEAFMCRMYAPKLASSQVNILIDIIHFMPRGARQRATCISFHAPCRDCLYQHVQGLICVLRGPSYANWARDFQIMVFFFPYSGLVVCCTSVANPKILERG